MLFSSSRKLYFQLFIVFLNPSSTDDEHRQCAPVFLNLWITFKVITIQPYPYGSFNIYIFLFTSRLFLKKKKKKAPPFKIKM